MMFKILNGLGPDCLSEMFSFSGQRFKYNLRNSTLNLSLPTPKTNFGKLAFTYSGAAAWNNLQRQAKESDSLASFKKNLTVI